MKKKTKTKSDRQKVFEEAYKMAKSKNLTVQDACAWATKKYGSKINKAEIQYWAMKNNLPYLDEIQRGIRVIVL